ncbi:hypothetical protein NDU88_002575 [Pleurodeles waltl]|uniref:Uncharacterized protein n=1 Tax=Pleurodeles waltl TaxID=8319 RepID=A0AAV7TLH9_PLEWA|nr:hypothetical protein NDU88_002575 [Pleurodeles waltl]
MVRRFGGGTFTMEYHGEGLPWVPPEVEDAVGAAVQERVSQLLWGQVNGILSRLQGGFPLVTERASDAREANPGMR